MLKWLLPVLACAVGIALFCAGMGYGLAAAGLPTPVDVGDAAAETRSASLGGWLMIAGGVVFAAGLTGLAVVSFTWIPRWRD